MKNLVGVHPARPSTPATPRLDEMRERLRVAMSEAGTAPTR